jgi:hypothetical protein
MTNGPKNPGRSFPGDVTVCFLIEHPLAGEASLDPCPACAARTLQNAGTTAKALCVPKFE